NVLNGVEQFRLKTYLIREKKDLEFIVYFILFQKKHINTFYDNELNKNYALILANKCGLKTPKTFITSSKEYLKRISLHNSLITKAIKFGAVILKNKHLSAGTVLYNNKIEELLPDQFYPSLFQEKLEKKYEMSVLQKSGKHILSCYV